MILLGNLISLQDGLDTRLEYEKVYYNTPKDLPGEAFRICGAYMDYDPNNIDPDTGSLGVNHIPSGYEHCFFESTYSISTTAYCTLLCFR
ncbi:MAG: hypothetical protein IH845_02090 [Nanoarchaeota archaeon]|nr:hypothetical protein [Nanoarchaeota archaeon]